MTSHLLNVLIIGAGNIGALFGAPNDTNVLSHAHAFSRSKHYNLLGFVDSIYAKALNAAKIWDCAAYISIFDAFAKNNIDVVIVASPDETHYELLRQLAKFKISIVIAEKPLTCSVVDSEEIELLYKKSDIPIVVNYTRRFVPEFTKIKDKIASGVFGTYLSGTGYYGKGLAHNGTHMIDTVQYLLSNILSTTAYSSINDYTESDKSWTVRLELDDGTHFYMNAIDSRCYTIFEIDLFFQFNRIKILNSGLNIEIYTSKPSDIYTGYYGLELSEVIQTSLYNSLEHLADNVYMHLKFNESLASTERNAILAQRIISKTSDLGL